MSSLKFLLQIVVLRGQEVLRPLEDKSALCSTLHIAKEDGRFESRHKRMTTSVADIQVNVTAIT
jgi:hypothetical protein